MPNRYIRASAIESESINALSWQAEVFYRRLLNRADDFGRFTASPPLLRASLFPLQLSKVSEKEISKLLAECEQSGLVFTYAANGKQLLVINKWEQGRAKSSEYPSPPADVIERMQTYVYTSKHKLAYAPDSDSDSVTDTDPSAQPKAGRVRNPLFDALAISEGSNPNELTQDHAKRIGVALAQIRKACPGLTQGEIQRRARIYASVMPAGTRCTASALAANWAKCSGEVVGFAKAKSVLRPPPKDWRIRLEREYPGNAVNLENRPWASLDDEIRAKVFPESGHDVEIQPTPLQLTQ